MPSDSRKRDRGDDRPSRRDKDRDKKKHSRSRHEEDDRRDGTDRGRDRDRERDRRKKHKPSRKSRDRDHNHSEDRRTRRKSDHAKRSRREKNEKDKTNEDDSSTDSRHRKRSKNDRRHHKSKSSSHKKSSREHTSRKEKKDKKKHDTSSKKSQKAKIIVDPSKLVNIGPISHQPPSTKLDPMDDYFSYHNHLRLYLYRKEGLYFEDLTSTETHEAFEKFCSEYNKGELEQGFYAKDGQLSEQALEQCKRTKHAWNFKTSAAEEKNLDLIRSGVKKQTAYDVKPPPVAQTKMGKDSGMCIPIPSERVPSRAVIPPRDDRKEAQRVGSAIGLSSQKQENQEAVLKSLGLGGLAGKKITIAPRK